MSPSRFLSYGLCIRSTGGRSGRHAQGLTLYHALDFPRASNGISNGDHLIHRATRNGGNIDILAVDLVEVMALAHPASQITPGPSGSWPLRFDQLVQPVLDRYCLECHRQGSKAPQAAKLDLSPGAAYNALLTFGGEDLKKCAFERDRSIPNQAVAATSKLWQLLSQPGGHQQIQLDPQSLQRLATWMDTYAQFQGHFSPQQEQELLAFRETLKPLLSQQP